MNAQLSRTASCQHLLCLTTRVARRSGALAMLLALLSLAAVAPAAAGEYSVSPMRIALDREARSSVVTLTNSGADRLDFQITVMEWTQDAEGRDRYAPSGDVVFFPKILSLQPGESRVVRVGVQAIPVARERTFRLFIEPISAPTGQSQSPGANISVNLRFALPIFVKPVQSEAAGAIDAVTLNKGVLTMTLRNSGTEHFRTDDGIALVGRDAQGNEVFKDRIDSRYVLAGISKSLSFPIPKGDCARLATLEILGRTEQFTLSRQLDVNRMSCE